MLKYKDVKLGQCWMFTDRPSRAFVAARQLPDDLPDGWDWDPPEDYDRWNARPVELLEHYSTHPRPTPLGKGGRQVWKVVEAREVRRGQMYIGLFSLDTAREVCQDINAERSKVEDYRNDVGPIQDDGFVIVHIVDHDDRHGAIAHLCSRKTQGLLGAECLERYERGMREERVMRVDGKTYVRANGDGGDGLTAMQVEAAQELWQRTLAFKREQAAEKERLRIVIDQETD